MDVPAEARFSASLVIDIIVTFGQECHETMLRRL
jgi:hypothetical protein